MGEGRAYIWWFIVFPIGLLLLQKLGYFALTGEWPAFLGAGGDCTIGRADIC